MFSLLRGSSRSPEPDLVNRVGALVLADPAVAEVPWFSFLYKFTWPPASAGPGIHSGTWSGLQLDPRTFEMVPCDGTWTMRNADAYWLLRRARKEYPPETKPCGFTVLASRVHPDAPGLVRAAWDLPHSPEPGH